MADSGLTLENLVDDRNYALGGSDRVRAENKALLDELDRKKRARTMAVPTDDSRVKARLREIGEPITLFGERAADRRDRLIYVLSQIRAARGGDDDIEMEDESSSSDEEAKRRGVLHGRFTGASRGSQKNSRIFITQVTTTPRLYRVAQQREESRLPLGKIIDTRKRVFGEVKKFATYGSQIGDERPISQVRFSPNGKLLATGSWSGNVKLWNVPACDLAKPYRGGKAFAENDKALHTLKGHADRVCRVAFHPSGQYLASASYDGSWRLWDASTGQNTSSYVSDRQLLFQEGHSKEVYAVQFQDDGALVASGYQIATGSGDNTIRIWDMRSLRALYTIGAHTSIVSDVSFYRPLATGDIFTDIARSSSSTDVKIEDGEDGSKMEEDKPAITDEIMDDRIPSKSVGNLHLPIPGLFLVSSGYDGMVKVWSADDWQLVKAMSADAGKVMSADISSDGQFIASGSWNRSYQLFSMEN
ncbi:hypothetical protein RhiTH_001534 [Rhizoctonia solani]